MSPAEMMLKMMNNAQIDEIWSGIVLFLEEIAAF